MPDSGTKALNIITFVVVIIAGIAAINWFTAEVLNFNVVSKIFGKGKTTLKKVVYTIIGVCGLLAIILAILLVGRHGFNYTVSNSS